MFLYKWTINASSTIICFVSFFAEKMWEINISYHHLETLDISIIGLLQLPTSSSLGLYTLGLLYFTSVTHILTYLMYLVLTLKV